MAIPRSRRRPTQTRVLGRARDADQGRRRRCVFGRVRAAKPLVLLDWDDTLLPTTNLAEAQKAAEQLAPDDLKEYGDIAAETLRRLASGRVVVVTNATEGWVDQTAMKHLPQLQPLLRTCEVVSARATYEPLGFEANEWKREMFAQQLRQHLAKGGARVVLSIGDASYEREAVLRVAPTFGCVAKSVKLLEKPPLAVLRAQHVMLQPQLEELVTSHAPCDLGVAPLS